MRKNRRRRNADEDDCNQTSELTETSADPLGKIIKQYHVSLAGILVVAGVIAAVGLGLVIYSLTRRTDSVIFLSAGTVVLLFSVVVLLLNVFNVGRRLELRKRGIRFVESGITIEFFWDEITDVAVTRTDNTNIGIGTINRRSSDVARFSGPFTKTEWDITIHGPDGRTIHLGPIFLRTVPDPKILISQLRLRAGTP